MFRRILRAVRNLIFLAVLIVLLQRSTVIFTEPIEQIRAYTRPLEFNYVNWTLDALWLKNLQGALAAPRYIPADRQRQVVLQYLERVRERDELEAQVEAIYVDPSVHLPEQAAASQLARLKELRQELAQLGPLSEAVLQQQLAAVLADQGLTLGGQPLPPVLYRVTELPTALIISPRQVIRQDYNISLEGNLPMDERVTLEKNVEQTAGVSALVVNIGGVGIYPTMVLSTTDLVFLSEVVAHEWTHNYLTLRPLGVSYDRTPELRTMNETAASIAGKELGAEVLRRFYPEFYHPPEPPAPSPAPPAASSTPAPQPSPTPPAFNFRAEMRKTRVQADELLKQGKIEEAEQYMEQRRQFLWEHGYQIRRLNQAYFAFNGAYDDHPGGGAAGSDPVGPAVRALRTQSASLADFLNRLSWMTAFSDLQQAVGVAP